MHTVVCLVHVVAVAVLGVDVVLPEDYSINWQHGGRGVIELPWDGRPWHYRIARRWIIAPEFPRSGAAESPVVDVHFTSFSVFGLRHSLLASLMNSSVCDTAYLNIYTTDFDDFTVKVDRDTKMFRPNSASLQLCHEKGMHLCGALWQIPQKWEFSAAVIVVEYCTLAGTSPEHASFRIEWNVRANEPVNAIDNRPSTSATMHTAITTDFVTNSDVDSSKSTTAQSTNPSTAHHQSSHAHTNTTAATTSVTVPQSASTHSTTKIQEQANVSTTSPAPESVLTPTDNSHPDFFPDYAVDEKNRLIEESATESTLGVLVTSTDVIRTKQVDTLNTALIQSAPTDNSNAALMDRHQLFARLNQQLQALNRTLRQLSGNSIIIV